MLGQESINADDFNQIGAKADDFRCHGSILWVAARFGVQALTGDFQSKVGDWADLAIESR